MMKPQGLLFAIDPGTFESGWVLCDMNAPMGERFLEGGIEHNLNILMRIDEKRDQLGAVAIEKIVSYGQTVGEETFETCRWSGRFEERWGRSVIYVERKEILRYLCGTILAKDPQLRQALVDRYKRPGEKVVKGKPPEALKGVKEHIWSALALAETVIEKFMEESLPF